MVGGSPCPGFCAWNPFKVGRQLNESLGLLVQFKAVGEAVMAALPQVAHLQIEENVASMGVKQRANISWFMGVEPLCLDLADISMMRRRRLYWASGCLRA